MPGEPRDDFADAGDAAYGRNDPMPFGRWNRPVEHDARTLNADGDRVRMRDDAPKRAVYPLFKHGALGVILTKAPPNCRADSSRAIAQVARRG
jgi:hypothetical protein